MLDIKTGALKTIKSLRSGNKQLQSKPSQIAVTPLVKLGTHVSNHEMTPIKVTPLAWQIGRPIVKGSAAFVERFWRLNMALQQSLALEDLIKQLLAEFVSEYQILGCQYHLSSEAISLIYGQSSGVVTEFQLCDQAAYLGDIRIVSAEALTATQLLEVQQCLSCAIFALRNALQYHQAVCNSLTDGLTQVGNRIAMDMCLQQEVDIARRYRQCLSVAMVDIDHFKVINDQYGHAIGDCVLTQMGKILTESIREADRVFRYGGEEFLLLLNKTDRIGANTIMERLRQSIAEMPFYDQLESSFEVTISVGLSQMLPSDRVEDLLARADAALYHAKRLGRNQVVIDDQHLDAFCA